MSFEDAAHHLVTTDPMFAVAPTTIRGVRYMAFKNIPGHLRALLQASRERHDNGAAEYLVFGSQRWTFDEFCIETRQMANALQAQLGVKKGDRIAIAMRNCPELLILFSALASLGAVTVFLNGWWTTEELDYALEDSEARIVFADAERIRRLVPLKEKNGLKIIAVRDDSDLVQLRYDDLLSASADSGWSTVDIDTDEDFAIMYSSGTTGHPKGVVQTHRGAMNAVFTWLMQAAMIPLIDPPAPDAPEPPRTAALIVTPLFHVTATHPLFLTSIPAGAKLAVMEKWDPEEAVRIIRDEAITRMLGVPTQSADLMAAAQRMGETLPTLDYLGSGGAKRPAAQVRDLKAAFPAAQVATGWGMTETNANGIGLIGPDYEERPGAAGRLYPPVQELMFLDESGAEVPPGEIGEITVKSPCNMRCYLNKPSETAEVMKDGWLRTGDLGFIDEAGIVTIVDRAKNIIIRGGENISCLDVEGALHRHPAVLEACAFSVPDARLGEVVGAGVQIRQDSQVSAADLQTFLQAHIARFKIPEHFWLRTSPLPRGATDKLDRRGLRETCLAQWQDKGDQENHTKSFRTRQG